MSYTTQCPACQTRFKVSDAHLALADGMVRCGRCSHVFHAPSHFDLPEPAAAPAPAPAATPTAAPPPRAGIAPQGSLRYSTPPEADDDDFELELPDFVPETATPAPAAPPRPALTVPDPDIDLPDFDLMTEPEQPLSWDELEQPPATPAPTAEPEAAAPAEEPEIAAFQRALAEALQPAPRSTAEPLPLVDEPTPAVSRQQRLAAQYNNVDDDADDGILPPPEVPLPEPDIPRFAPREQPAPEQEAQPRSSGWMGSTALALLGILGVVFMLLQLAFINRTAVSAELPEMRPAFESLCKALGCEVALPTQRQLIRTEWSELSFVPQNDHLIQLNATLKNLAPYPQAFPVMELSLKDGDDRVLIRKTLAPAQYLAPEDYKLGRFNANSELKIVTRMEVQQAKALGYSLHFYYP